MASGAGEGGGRITLALATRSQGCRGRGIGSIVSKRLFSACFEGANHFQSVHGRFEYETEQHVGVAQNIKARATRVSSLVPFTKVAIWIPVF